MHTVTAEFVSCLNAVAHFKMEKVEKLLRVQINETQ